MSKKTVRESTSAIRKCLLKSCFDLGPLVSDEVKDALTRSYSTICEELHNIESSEIQTTTEDPALPLVSSASLGHGASIRTMSDVTVLVNGSFNKIPLRDDMIHYDDVVAKTPISIKSKPLVLWRNNANKKSGFLYPHMFLYCEGLRTSNLLIRPPTFTSDLLFDVVEDVEGVNTPEDGIPFDNRLVEVEINGVKALVRHREGWVLYNEIVRISGVKAPKHRLTVTYSTIDGRVQEMSPLSSIMVCTNLLPDPMRPDIYVSNNKASFIVVDSAIKA